MTRKGVKTGTKLPSCYETGNPYVNLCFAILRQSKRADGRMWQDFTKTDLYKDGMKSRIDTMEIAEWVSRYIG